MVVDEEKDGEFIGVGLHPTEGLDGGLATACRHDRHVLLPTSSFRSFPASSHAPDRPSPVSPYEMPMSERDRVFVYLQQNHFHRLLACRQLSARHFSHRNLLPTCPVSTTWHVSSSLKKSSMR